MGNLIIIGAGLAGLSAAITAGRMGIKCILISEQVLKIPEMVLRYCSMHMKSLPGGIDI